MPLPETKDFLKTVIKRIHFFPDREDIRIELKDHIEDSRSYLEKEEGIPGKIAELEALKRMGDPDEIGRELNRQHNPVLGYAWYLSRIIAVLIVILLIVQSIPIWLLSTWSFLFDHPIRNISKEEYISHTKPNLLIKVDKTRTRITDIVQSKDGTLHIFYSTYNQVWPSYKGWKSTAFGEIEDEEGNKYFGGGYLGGGLYSRGWNRYKDFPRDSKIIINYDNSGRSYRLVLDPKGEEKK